MVTEKNILADFPILQREIHGKRLAYLDNAATTLKPRQVIDRLANHYLLETSNIHRGVHYLSEMATQEFEKSREKIKEFINAQDSAEVIFTSGTTESINLIAQTYGRSLKPGDEILITGMEHHSNIVPWQMLCEEKNTVLKVIPLNEKGEIIFEEFEKLISEKTKLLSVVYISNALGTINPIRQMISIAKKFGVPVLLDAAQAVAHTPVDVQELDCDFLVFSGHKMFGPTGIGVLYGKKHLLEKLPPWKGGGDMILSVTFEKTIYNKLPFRLEAGTPNIAGAIALGTAVDYIKNLGWKFIEEKEKHLLEFGTKILSEIPGVRIIGTAAKKAGVISFWMDEVHPHDIGTLLDHEGVAIRTGHHCAQPVMKHFGIPATARASFSVYNTEEDFQQLATAILKVKELFS